MLKGLRRVSNAPASSVLPSALSGGAPQQQQVVVNDEPTAIVEAPATFTIVESTLTLDSNANVESVAVEALENEESFARPDASGSTAIRRAPPLRDRLPSLKQGDTGGIVEEVDTVERLKMTEKLISELNEPWEAKHMRTNAIIQQRYDTTSCFH